MSDKSLVRSLMELFHRLSRETEDNPARSQPFRIPREEIPEGLQQERKAAFERLASQGNPMSTSGPSTSHKKWHEKTSAAEAAGSHHPKIVLKPADHSQSVFQGMFKTIEKQTEEKRVSASKINIAKKVIQEQSDPAHTFCKTDSALGAGTSSSESQEKEEGDGSSRHPRKKILAPVFKLTPAPAKPNRPPHVELRGYQKSIPKKKSENEGQKLAAPSSEPFTPVAPLVHSATQVPTPAPSSHSALELMEAPSLPPRNIKPSSEAKNLANEENYDDVEFVSQGHGSTQRGQESDVEMYEDINDIRSSRKEEKKQNKEDKRRLEQEKREQKEKEKKELELKKKFKLVQPIEVLHQARACVDHKGGKGELTFKQGDKIEIIRLTDNPEGKWLGRIAECYGYIKTTMVEIDYDSLKRKQQAPTGADAKFSEIDMEVYDDVGEQESVMSLGSDNSGARNVFPPPPSFTQDIYDEIGDEDSIARSVSQDEDKNGIWSWGILKRLKVKDDKKKSIREKPTKVNGAEDNGNWFTSSSTQQLGRDYGEAVYDDVDSSVFPPPPPDVTSLKLASFGKRKLDEKDVQRQQKMTREEIEFRRKFEFVGEIKVLFSATAVQNLPKKKWGSKELHIKPGESLDIIESTDDTKVLCRNEEGKYGYVLRSNLVQNEGEIYDIVGEEMD